MLTFTIPGQPVPKGRPRATTIGGHARMYTPAKTLAYESTVAIMGKKAMNGKNPYTCAIRACLDMAFAIPASWPKKRRQAALDGLELPTHGIDVDNAAKSVLDGLNGIVWVDDAQVVDLMARKRYSAEPGVTVFIEKLKLVEII